MRYVVDGTWRRVSRASVLAGSPMRMFRVSTAGEHVLDRLRSGGDVGRSDLVDRLLDAGAIHPRPLHRELHEFGPADVTVVTPQLGGTVPADGRITVDDGSVPALVGATVRLPTNRGPAAARNEGRRHVTTQLIAFVDADVDVARDVESSDSWLDALLPHFDDPRVGLAAPRVTGDPHSSLDLGAEPARIRSGTRVSYVPAAAVVVRADAFDEIGGFDETLRFGEDVDFVWRLDQAGWTCRYEPAASVWHRPRDGLRGRLRQQAGYGSSSAPLAMRHPTEVAPFRSDAPTAAAWASVALGHPLVGIVVAIGNVASAVRRLPLPAATAARLALTAQLDTGRQIATATRRAWWPILAMAALVSKRARRLLLAAVVVSPDSALTDLAFGWGMWSGMIRRHAWRPIIPRISRR